MRLRRAQLENQGGFTLFEVMITIIIMGIVFAIASSTWFGVVESRRVDSATNLMVSDLRLAHMKSTNRLVKWAVVKDLSSLSVDPAVLALVPPADYYLVRIPNPPETIAASDITAGRELPEGTQIDTATFNVRFNPSGTVEPIGGSGLTVTVGSEDGDVDSGPEHEINLIAATSLVQVVN
jgi:prepilin-type N-terminal cleavage/methylation domain-containing protein